MRQPVAGWLFVTPMIVVLGLFLPVPIGVMAPVGVRSDWTGREPCSGQQRTMWGFKNHTDLLTKQGSRARPHDPRDAQHVLLRRRAVPAQTALVPAGGARQP